MWKWSLLVALLGCDRPETSNAEVEPQTAEASAAPDGPKAPTRSWLGFDVGSADAAAIASRLSALGLECTEQNAPARLTVQVDCRTGLTPALLPDRTIRGVITRLFLVRAEDGPLHHLSVDRRYSIPEAAREDYAGAVTSLRTVFGEPARHQELPESALGSRVVHAATIWRFADLEVTASAFRFGRDELTVSERWVVPHLISGAGDRPGYSGHGSARSERYEGETGDIARAEGSLPIEQVFAERAELAGREILVTGRLVKTSMGIFGTNWYHLQDGTGSEEAETHDLTVTSDVEVKVGDVVTFRGPLTIDKDLGFGYFYPAIIEGAELVPAR